jgi:deferrochelatase/peroxidase EfeB
MDPHGKKEESVQQNANIIKYLTHEMTGFIWFYVSGFKDMVEEPTLPSKALKPSRVNLRSSYALVMKCNLCR